MDETFTRAFSPAFAPMFVPTVAAAQARIAAVAKRHALDVQHKFVYELGWRAYFRHVWQHRGDGILQSLHEGPLPDAGYAREMPADIRQACTGVPVVDEAVRSIDEPHLAPWLPAWAECGAVPALFPSVDRRCDSFSPWWNRATRGLNSSTDLLAVNEVPAW